MNLFNEVFVIVFFVLFDVDDYEVLFRDKIFVVFFGSIVGMLFVFVDV